MSKAEIKAVHNTATGTKISTNRLGARALGRGELGHRATALSRGILDDLAVGYTYPAAVQGVQAYIDHRRHHLLSDLGTVVARETEVVANVTDFVRVFRLATGSMHAYELTPASSWSVHWQTGTELPHREVIESSEQELETIDWDVRIETPPARDSVWITVEFVEGSYRSPRIVDDLED